MKKKVRYLVDQDTNHGKVKKGDELLVDAEVADLEVGRKLAEYIGSQPVKDFVKTLEKKYGGIAEKAYIQGPLAKVDKETHEALMKDCHSTDSPPETEPIGQIETSLETPPEYKNWDIPREVIKPLPIKADEDKKDTTKVEVESKPVRRKKKRKKYTFNKS